MGYSYNRDTVIQNSELLDTVVKNLQRGTATVVTPPPDDSRGLSYWQYEMHRLLKAAEEFRDVEAGKYASLRAVITVRVDTEKRRLLLQPKIAKSEINQLLVTANHFTERDLIEDLRYRPASRPMETRMFEFFPTPDYNQEELVKAAEEEGWKLGPNFIRDDPSDPISVTAVDMSTGMDSIEAQSRRKSAMRNLGFGAQENGQ